MATVNQTTMDTQQVTQYFQRTREGGLIQLPFVLTTIDADFQAYQPIHLNLLDENLRRLRVGSYTAPVILDQNVPLPIAVDNAKFDQFSVFECRMA